MTQLGHSHMYRSQYHIYRDKPQLFGYKKNWIRRTKLLEGNRYSLSLDFFPQYYQF